GMLLALPLTMAYGIVVHRAMDVRVVIRQGMQYLLAAGSVHVVQVVVSVLIVVGLATMSATTVSAASRVAIIALSVGLTAWISVFARRLRGWVDRRFFREAYEADAILGELAVKVRTIVETGTLLETVATRISHSMHVPRIAILLDGGGRFVPAYALGYPATTAVVIPEESVTVQRLRKQQHAVVRFDDEDSWVQLTDGIERASLE